MENIEKVEEFVEALLIERGIAHLESIYCDAAPTIH